MSESSNRGLVIACIVLFVFPIAVTVGYTLFAFPFSALLSLVLGASRTVALFSMVVSLAVGIATGVWICRLAWPRRP